MSGIGGSGCIGRKVPEAVYFIGEIEGDACRLTTFVTILLGDGPEKPVL